MAQPTASHDSLTVEEYLKLEEGATVRHEYVGGEIFAMVGGTTGSSVTSSAVSGVLLAGAIAGCIRRVSNCASRKTSYTTRT